VADLHPAGQTAFTFDLANRGFRILKAGLYLITGTVTMTAGGYIVRAFAGRTLGQAAASSASFTSSVSGIAWLPVNALVTMEVYATAGTLSIAADTAGNPSMLNIAQLPSIP
jgi:uncharacterized membrane protein